MEVALFDSLGFELLGVLGFELLGVLVLFVVEFLVLFWVKIFEPLGLKLLVVLRDGRLPEELVTSLPT